MVEPKRRLAKTDSEKEKLEAEARLALLGYYKDELVSHATIEIDRSRQP